MRRRHTYLSLITALALVLGLSACGTGATNNTNTAAKAPAVTVRVASMKGPTSVGLVELMDQASHQKAQQAYNFTVAGSPDAVTGPLATGKLDIAIIPLNLAATLYNKTQGGVQAAATTDTGMFYLVSTDPSVTKLTDLSGKTILSTGKGTTPQIVINKVLGSIGLVSKTKLDWRSQPTEITSLMAAKPNQTALLPEPFVSTVMAANPKVHVVDDLNQTWQKLTGLPLTTDCVAVRTAFAKQHPAALTTFLKEYEASVQFVNGQPAKAAPLLVAKGLAPNTAVAQKAIPRINLVIATGAAAKKNTEAFLQVLNASNPASIGGSLPSDSFYYGA